MASFRRLLVTILFAAGAGSAHVGSPDIYLEGSAGPYKLFVTIRPPQVIPGVADILVRSESPGVTDIQAVPLPLSGPGADHPPIADPLTRSLRDPQFYSGSLWLMADGSWQVRLSAKGAQGPGTLSIPVPAVAQSIRRMDASTGVILSIFGLFLAGGLAAICGATVCEAKLDAEAPVPEGNRRRGYIAMLVASGVIAAVLFGGKAWWDTESETFRRRIYQPLNMQARLVNSSVLQLKLSEPGWMQPSSSHPQAAQFTRALFVRQIDDLVLDHDHLMHLYVVREPGFDVVCHLHPDQTQPDEFRLPLPSLPAGSYKLYADVVHGNGLPETLSSSLILTGGVPAAEGRPLTGDDACLDTKPVNEGMLGTTFILPDGYQMRWVGKPASLKAREGQEFQFALLTPDLQPPADMKLYMGMLGHAAFLKTDGTTFAHIHPNGTVAMAAFMMAQSGNGMTSGDSMAGGHSIAGSDSMAGMPLGEMGLGIPNQVAFPYGLPSPGRYRIFVQMKHGATVETGAFDAVAE